MCFESFIGLHKKMNKFLDFEVKFSRFQKKIWEKKFIKNCKGPYI